MLPPDRALFLNLTLEVTKTENFYALHYVLAKEYNLSSATWFTLV